MATPGMVMINDFYCDEALSGHTPIRKVLETDNVLAFHHTRPFYPVHVVVIPKNHIGSLLTMQKADDGLLLELIEIVRQVASGIVEKHGACRILTNLGEYQDSKHLHWHVAFGDPLP
jgi:histidine triad (HIT) family protein